MTQQPRRTIRRHFRGYTYALRGVRQLFKTELNAWVHLTIALCAITLGVILHISRTEWMAIALSCGLVLGAEAINTAIEYLANHCTTERNEQIGKVKDLAAGAVLICAIAAGAVGLLIFIPKIF